VFVVLFSPAARQLSHLFKVAEQIQVQQFIAQAMVNALDMGILVRIAGFDIVNRDAIGFAPVDEDLTQELRAIVHMEV
jgi:hypothetical protein